MKALGMAAIVHGRATRAVPLQSASFFGLAAISEGIWQIMPRFDLYWMLHGMRGRRGRAVASA